MRVLRKWCSVAINNWCDKYSEYLVLARPSQSTFDFRKFENLSIRFGVIKIE